MWLMKTSSLGKGSVRDETKEEELRKNEEAKDPHRWDSSAPSLKSAPCPRKQMPDGTSMVLMVRSGRHSSRDSHT